MPRLSNRLTALGLRTLPAGKHLDGSGLYLIKSSVDSGRWMLRYRQFGRRRDMGLGGWPAVGHADARRGADAARQQMNSGWDQPAPSGFLSRQRLFASSRRPEP
jgi:hypothetical protein